MIFGLLYLFAVQNPSLTFFLSECEGLQTLTEDMTYFSENQILFSETADLGQLPNFDCCLVLKDNLILKGSLDIVNEFAKEDHLDSNTLLIFSDIYAQMYPNIFSGPGLKNFFEFSPDQKQPILETIERIERMYQDNHALEEKFMHDQMNQILHNE